MNAVEKFKTKMSDIIGKWAEASADAQAKIEAHQDAELKLAAASEAMDAALDAEHAAFEEMMSFRNDLLDGGVLFADDPAPQAPVAEPAPEAPASDSQQNAGAEPAPAPAQAPQQDVGVEPTVTPVAEPTPARKDEVLNAGEASPAPAAEATPQEQTQEVASGEAAPFRPDIPEPPVFSGSDPAPEATPVLAAPADPVLKPLSELEPGDLVLTVDGPEVVPAIEPDLATLDPVEAAIQSNGQDEPKL